MVALLSLGDLRPRQFDEPARSAQWGRRLQCLVVTSGRLSRRCLLDARLLLLLGHSGRSAVQLNLDGELAVPALARGGRLEAAMQMELVGQVIVEVPADVNGRCIDAFLPRENIRL